MKHLLLSLALAVALPVMAAPATFTTASGEGAWSVRPKSLTINAEFGIRFVDVDIRDGRTVTRLRLAVDGCSIGHGQWAFVVSESPLRLLDKLRPWAGDNTTVASLAAAYICALPL